jgi:hypothetical protein
VGGRAEPDHDVEGMVRHVSGWLDPSGWLDSLGWAALWERGEDFAQATDRSQNFFLL